MLSPLSKNTNKLSIGYVSQNSPFIDDSILNNIAFDESKKLILIKLITYKYLRTFDLIKLARRHRFNW